MPQTNYLEDPDFLDALLSLLISDRQFLRTTGHLIDGDDFAGQGTDLNSRARWIVGTKALEHWNKFREPICDVLSSELQEYSKLSRLGPRQTKQFLDYGKKLVATPTLAPASITEKLIEWKKQVVLSKAISDFIDAQADGSLDTSRFLAIAREAVSIEAKFTPEEDEFFELLDDRIERRANRGVERFFPLLIEPYDAEVRAIARGHIGLILAPYKRGKSLMLLQIAIAYILQRLNVIYLTLEDPKIDVEDRFDAAISNLPIRDLPVLPNRLRNRIRRFLRLAKGRLKVFDGTEQSYSVAQIEQLWIRERENGFNADAIIIDYDDEIMPPRQHKDRRFEFADIYRELRRFAAKEDLLLWTAAQTKRGTGKTARIEGDDVAEDISKIRKVSCAISIGQGEWKEEENLFLYVAAHKYDKQNVGVNIISNKANSLIYDRDRTFEAMKRHFAKQSSSSNGSGPT